MPDALALIHQPEGVTGPAYLVDPDTGEAVLVADASPQLITTILGHVQAQLDEATTQLREAKRWLGRELIERMDRDLEWTVRAKGVKVSAPSPAAKRYTWSGDELQPILDDLVKAGKITPAAMLRACRQDVTYTPIIAGINKLLKVEEIAPLILTARHEQEPPTRGVKVEVDPGEL